MEISVEYPLDADGFLRRECPHCTGEFKWHHGPVESRPNDAVDPPRYSCPLCGQTADHDQWFTQAQVQYQHDIVNFYATDVVNEELKKAFRGSKNIKFTPGRSTAPTPEPLTEPDDMLIIESPCHPWEPVKLPHERVDSGPVYCLVCGEPFSA
ncbi:hypothetical protein [Mycobacterium sp. GA-2829]|uniref:hypothetical protein n=1 Tax=Mycobacterium sp. GA-2829 TaxID=1772283 RepID=UPI0009E89579|nr:hypothetical protein [Mycobacterium sp. GA-2829]